MENYIIPSVGVAGTYNVNAPFNTMIIADKFCICQAVRSISDIVNQGVYVLTTLYLANTLTEVDYQKDLSEKVPIVTFKDELGNTFQLPGRYIKTVPYTTGYVYRTYLLGISLGDFEENYDFSPLMSDLSDYVENTLGVKPAITVVPVSARYHVTDENHQTIFSRRNAMTLIKTTLNGRIAILTRQLQAALLKIKALETYLKNNYNLP